MKARCKDETSLYHLCTFESTDGFIIDFERPVGKDITISAHGKHVYVDYVGFHLNGSVRHDGGNHFTRTNKKKKETKNYFLGKILFSTQNIFVNLLLSSKRSQYKYYNCAPLEKSSAND